ncbi:MAG TPA: hypothetical protein VH761_15900 [Ilumatobacteraceae bacterium]|jgi:hypothetical protein
MNNTTTSSPTNTDNNQRRSSSGRRKGFFAGLLALTAIAFLITTGCTASQRRALGEEDVKDTLTSYVKKALNDEKLSLEGHLQCTSDIDTASNMSASCAGITKDGNAVHGTLTGTANVENETCTGDVSVAVADTQIAIVPGIHCFDSI